MNRPELGRAVELPLRLDDRNRVELAQRSRTMRQYRTRFFGPRIARDLPWDILLALYVAESRSPVTATSLHAEIDAPWSSILRWLRTLEAKDLVVREMHPSDRRIAYLALSEPARLSLDQYFDAAAGVGAVIP